MVKLSVVVITLNEERNLRRCLESVKTIADEILVLDSFSTDKTEEIARSFGARFVQHTFEGHIEQKNVALNLASHDYILSLDADEALSPDLQKSVLYIKSKWNAQAYSMNRLTNYCGQFIRHGGWYPDRKIRLFKRSAGKWGGENPHDRFITAPGISIVRLKGDILHYSYYSIEGHIGQVNKFTSIGAKSAFAAGKRSNFIYLLFSPCIKFVKDYFLKAGFLDGYYGWVIARISAHATYLKYVKLRELEKMRFPDEK